MKKSILPPDFSLNASPPVSSVAILSDTHGVLRAEAVDALRDVDQILHAGDVGSESVLLQLEALAPVIAVRGNVDTGAWADRLPVTAFVRLSNVGVFLIHNIADLARHPPPSDTRVVLYGHSHKPAVSHEDGILYINPGSAGLRRFSLPICLILGRPGPQDWNFSFVDLSAGA